MKVFLCIDCYVEGDTLVPIGYGTGHDLIVVAEDVNEARELIRSDHRQRGYWNPVIDEGTPDTMYIIEEIPTDKSLAITTTGGGLFKP